MFLRAEWWWLWHILVCLLSYYAASIPFLDWVLMLAYLLANYAFVTWVRGYSLSRTRCMLCIFISQAPLIIISISALCLLSGLFYNDIAIFLLQLSSAVFYPLISLSPDTFINDYQAYLWVASILLLLQSITMLFLMYRHPVYNDPRNSYIEHDPTYTAPEPEEED